MAAYFTKAEMVGQALLAISGGTITPDLTVRRGECETYLAMACNYVQTGNYWLETKAESEKTINPLLLTTFENIAIEYSDDHRRYYSDLPKNVITLPKGRALKITTMCGKMCFPLDEGAEALEEYYGKYKAMISFKLEGPRRVWWYNKPKLVSAIRPSYIVAIHDLDDDDEIILPSDAYAKVIDLMVNFLNGEKLANKDYTEDQKPN